MIGFAGGPSTADGEKRKQAWNLGEEIAAGSFYPIPGVDPNKLPGYTVKEYAKEHPLNKHLIEIVNIEPGRGKYSHWHDNAETFAVILEGRGEYLLDEDGGLPVAPGDFIHSLPGELHGARNTGDGPLRYIKIVGPLPL